MTDLVDRGAGLQHIVQWGLAKLEPIDSAGYRQVRGAPRDRTATPHHAHIPSSACLERPGCVRSPSALPREHCLVATYDMEYRVAMLHGTDGQTEQGDYQHLNTCSSRATGHERPITSVTEHQTPQRRRRKPSTTCGPGTIRPSNYAVAKATPIFMCRTRQHTLRWLARAFSRVNRCS
jgi:hypothetical protein